MSSHRPGEPLAVFAQSGDARVDIDAWRAHATRFFATRIDLREPGDLAGGTGAAVRFVVAPDGRQAGTRSARARECTVADFARADAAEQRGAGAGLSFLARRCKTLWLIDRDAPQDTLALRLAAILSSILLGPTLDLETGELFGVKTARAKIAAIEG